jgi:transcriptional regulator
MYIPKANEEKRVPVMHELMTAHPLAALITMNASGLIASHVPLVLEDNGSQFGMLKGHLSRANTQWKDTTLAVHALAIFAGAQHYITPSWYPAKQEHSKVVPTWNYAVVHAYGPIQWIEEPDWLMNHLAALVDTHEAAFAKPWKMTDSSADYIQSQVKGIIGFEIPIHRLEGKWKVSQNRDRSDKQGVVKGLAALNTSESQAMSDLVEEALWAIETK